MGFVTKWEDDLIPLDQWKLLYKRMPKECQEIVDSKIPEPIGIGYNKKLGWFIAGSGQGPSILWKGKRR